MPDCAEHFTVLFDELRTRLLHQLLRASKVGLCDVNLLKFLVPVTSQFIYVLFSYVSVLMDYCVAQGLQLSETTPIERRFGQLDPNLCQ
jgi:hypothetical protein